MNKVLVSFDESNFNSQKEGLENCVSAIQNVVKDFNAFGYESLKSNELQKLFTETNDLFFDKITKGQQLSIGGIDIDKSKALDIIKKPIGYEKILSAISDVIKTLQDAATEYKLQAIKYFSLRTIESVFELNTDGLVTVKSVVLDDLKNINELYAQTPRAIKLYELATMIAEKCKEPEIAEVIKNNPDGFSKVIKNLFKEHKYNSPDVIIEPANIVKYNQPGVVIN